ncbi:sulfatase-like hydrolase/transferase [Halalkalicoccus salilacus]|uniref:sulfatase-like hydrolase/transferase n=1 Tax=Halalkalicoccus sp. GCM10025704 TaxID=3252662 RepID=UPI003614E0AC
MDQNVFVLTVDSLNYAYFEDGAKTITDEVDGVNYTKAIAAAPKTKSAMPALSSGVFADELPGVGLPSSAEYQTLAETLQNEGYQTAMWSDNYLFGEEYNYNRGFEGGDQGGKSFKKELGRKLQNSPMAPAFGSIEWLYFSLYKPLVGSLSSEETLYRQAEELHSDALSWLESTNNGVTLVWIHYMDTHHPYEPPSKYLEAESFNTVSGRSEIGQFTRSAIKSNGEGLSEEQIEDVVTAYKASCHYLEDEVMRFIRELKKKVTFAQNAMY